MIRRVSVRPDSHQLVTNDLGGLVYQLSRAASSSASTAHDTVDQRGECETLLGSYCSELHQRAEADRPAT